jgi:cyanosortase A-associated protein
MIIYLPKRIWYYLPQMRKNFWRLGLIWLTIVFIFVVLVNTLFFNSVSSITSLNSPRFPTSIVLKEWYLVTSTPLVNSGKGYLYHYRHGETQQDLFIKIYTESNTDGNVSRLLNLHQNIKLAKTRSKIRNDPQRGYFAIFAHKGNLHITSCISLQGYSTVTEAQFSQYRYKNFNLSQRLFPWLIGAKPLADNECWWVLFSTPFSLNSTRSELSTNIRGLESAWADWMKQFQIFLKG